jgi:hypothetical protein
MHKKKPLSSTFLSAVLLLAVIGAFCVSIVAANPIVGPDIWVTSPKNKGSYNSGNVQLVFYPDTNIYVNYTAFTYSLDGQPSRGIDMNSYVTSQPWGYVTVLVRNITLVGLSWGSHTVVVSGIDTYGKVHSSWTVHFDVVLNTVSVLPAAILAAMICFVVWVSYKKRVFQGKKTGVFWFWLVWSLFFAAVSLAIVWQIVEDYFYSGYGGGVSVGPVFFVFLLVFPFSFMIMGFFMMKSRLKKSTSIQPKDHSP